MTPFDSLMTYVSAVGGSFVSEFRDPEPSGSASAIFETWNGVQFRLVWDGKADCGFLQTETGPDEWETFGLKVRPRAGSGCTNLQAFLKSAELLASGALDE